MRQSLDGSPQRDHILIVEDDEGIRELLTDYLTQNGFICSALPDGSKLRETMDRARPDLVVMDLMLPGEDGLTLTRNLRAGATTAHIPIIMLTARVEETDRIIGLEMGADDYLPKPFNPRELLARINSVMRRARSEPVTKSDSSPVKGYRFSGWYLDIASRKLSAPDGEPITLSRKEYELLNIFLQNPQTLLNRDAIMMRYGGREASPFERGIDVQIGRLRKRLQYDNADPQEMIKTVWGQGYMLDVLVETMI
ncbi:two component transcriptional regulator, winged helix family [Magnetococcus marinus MC-1]|uniref:Two component transcriptional regulator, winged helix family n=1 Tax=Magnetococcus marinus (strain ATCC BAA-1437 / JCM 17883 / MC-1) TaxID=156889 RepID=A0LA52_MAGMM|nr:response regulator [Magnetococcus marinus]ABK44845.1 two component transcriptional regulator, winged helix family [Magnetococcus marinus MC-1]